MKQILILAGLLSASSVLAVGESVSSFGRHGSSCDVRHALHVLERLSATGESFCDSLLHTKKGHTSTVSTLVTLTETCSIRTITTTEHATFTTTIYGKTTTLPQLTIPSYSSTVLIPSGSPRIVDKREVYARGLSTPSALTSCLPDRITSACSSLLAPTTATVSSTVTRTKHSCLITTTETITTTRHTTTSKIPFIVTQPPYSPPATGVLTTTVPADCAGPLYSPPDVSVPDGDMIVFPQYPDQPGTAVECCVVCQRTLDCIGSSFDPDSGECALLVHVGNSTDLGVSGLCPLGRSNYDFVTSPAGSGDIYPGPCGY